MQEKRRHKRYNLDLIDINGKMSLTDKVEILDISLGGVALKADRRLNIGKEYTIRLQEKGKTLDVKGIVVRSELSGIEARDHGETASIYTAGLVFKDGFADKIADFLRPIEQNKKKNSPAGVDRRFNVRFNITTPGKHILSYPLQFKVRSISLGGMLIPRIGAADPAIAGLVVMAGAARPLERAMVEQMRYLAMADGAISAEEQAQIDEVSALAAKIGRLTPTGTFITQWSTSNPGYNSAGMAARKATFPYAGSSNHVALIST